MRFEIEEELHFYIIEIRHFVCKESDRRDQRRRVSERGILIGTGVNTPIDFQRSANQNLTYHVILEF